MKITEEYDDMPTLLIEVVQAKYLGDFVIHIKFNDDTERMIDFQPFLRNSFHPSIRKYLDENLFQQFDIVDGNLNWNDYDLIFPLEDLYEGYL
jgi:hypothetical protein